MILCLLGSKTGDSSMPETEEEEIDASSEILRA